MTKSHPSSESLFTGFQNPPSEARPFVRWWWPGSAVDQAGIDHELDLLHAAGIGGVEINPLGNAKEGATPRPFLSKSWSDAIRMAVDAAHSRGMIADLIGGVGWPYGGIHVSEEHGGNSFKLLRREITGPQRLTTTIEDLEQHDIVCATTPPLNRNHFMKHWKASPSPTRFHSLRLVSQDASELDPGVDLTGRVDKQGRFTVEIPEGPFLLCAIVYKRGYRDITASDSGDVFARRLCHFNEEAVRSYLKQLEEALNAAFDSPHDWPLRSVFCDSYELGEEFWPMDFIEQFQARRGYDISDSLHYVMDTPERKAELPFAEEVRRISEDMLVTFQELFRERFVSVFNDWCHRHGVKSRIQAYGRPWTGLSGKCIADIPEGECWMWKKAPLPLRDWFFNPVANRITATAAHLNERPVVSCETFTAPGLNGRLTLDRYKQGADMLMVTGINNIILHGHGYSPADRAFPGWWAMGTFVSQHNTWWPHFRKWTDYVARLSWISQSTQPQAQIALLGPGVDPNLRLTDDSYWFPWHQAESGGDFPVHLTDLWQAFSACGYTCDVVSETIVCEATHEKGQLCYGPAAYDAIVVVAMEDLPAETRQVLDSYVEAGGTVIYSGSSHEPLPVEGQHLAWVRETLTRYGVAPRIQFTQPHPDLLLTHRCYGDHDILFFSNQNRQEVLASEICFRATSGGVPWQWDPESGERTPIPCGNDPHSFTLELSPLESILIVYDHPSKESAASPADNFASAAVPLEGPWEATFTPPVGEAFTRRLESLFDLSQATDKVLQEFGGTVTYRCQFDCPDADVTLIDLGRVCNIAEVTLNGKSLGCRWYGHQQFPVGNILKASGNELCIQVTTPLFNFLRGWREKDAQVALKVKADAELEPSGLMGPVRLLTQALEVLA